MVRVIRAGEARDLHLPGRKSVEIVSATSGAKTLSLRLVEIPVPRPGDISRTMHRHDGFEECIYVLSGEGIAQSESGESPVAAGDTIVVPAGELHVTLNTGDSPLRLLCFFPTGSVNNER